VQKRRVAIGIEVLEVKSHGFLSLEKELASLMVSMDERNR
jgi:hypothetical protein